VARNKSEKELTQEAASFELSGEYNVDFDYKWISDQINFGVKLPRSVMHNRYIPEGKA